MRQFSDQRSTAVRSCVVKRRKRVIRSSKSARQTIGRNPEAQKASELSLTFEERDVVAQATGMVGGT